jgi:phage terminase small subunit
MKKKLDKKTYSLNPLRARFCKEYLIDLNGTQAAIRSGYSSRTADVQASQLLGNLNVQAEINRLRKKREDRLEASADFVVRELMRLAKFDIREAFNPDGSLKEIKDMSEDVGKCISGIDVEDLWAPKEEGHGKERIGYTKKIRTYNKIGALDLLGEHFGIYKRPVDADPKKEGELKKMDLLTLIKTISKDGTTTIVENRVSGGEAQSSRVDCKRPRSYQIL